MTAFPRICAGPGAASLALRVGVRLWPLLSLFALFAFERGGVGAVRVGISSALVSVDVLIFLGAIVANRAFARWARRSAAPVRSLHMSHSVTLIAIPLAILLWPGGLVGGAMSPSGWGAPIALMLILSLNIGQMGILAALLASYAWAPGKPAFGG